jgi:DNA-binding IclR family transcriptional regulator
MLDVVPAVELREEAMPVLKEMAQRTGESAHLMVLEAYKVLSISGIKFR